MIIDDWRTVEEALALLGEGWTYTSENLMGSSSGCLINQGRKIRVFDGTEHDLAQKDMVIVNSTPFQKWMK